jgi:hypothetical protein
MKAMRESKKCSDSWKTDPLENDPRFKSKSYTKTLQIVLEPVTKSAVANRSINLKTTKQVRELTILIVDDVERKILKIMIIKNIMKKLQIKRIRKIIRLNNDDLKIQTKFEKIKNYHTTNNWINHDTHSNLRDANQRNKNPIYWYKQLTRCH